MIKKQKGVLSKIRRRNKYGNINTITLKNMKQRRFTQNELNKLKLLLSSLKAATPKIKVLSNYKKLSHLPLYIFNINTNIPKTAKGILQRMGKGKGKITTTYARLYKNQKILSLLLDKNPKILSLLKNTFKKFPFIKFF